MNYLGRPYAGTEWNRSYLHDKPGESFPDFRRNPRAELIGGSNSG